MMAATALTPPVTCDVCVVGAGPAGSTAAYLLSQQGYSVALVDRARFPRDKTCGDAITPRGTRVLERIGALDGVKKQGFTCRGVDIRGPGLGDSTVEFSLDFDKQDKHGPGDLIVLPRHTLDHLLLQHALTAGPRYFEASKVTDIERHDTHARVITDSDLVIEAKTVVLATGAESQLLRSCGLLTEKPPLEHAARVYFEGVQGLSDRLILFFDGVDLPGYGWIFPTSATSANIGCGAFVQSPEESKAQALRGEKQMPQAQRLETLITSHPLLRRMLAHATPSGPVRAYPLRTDFHRDFAGSGRLMVIGEAAGLVNPITGEGIDYALESAEFLAMAFAQHGPMARSKSPSLSAPLDETSASRITEDYRKRLSRRFTNRFALYRKIQQHALSQAQTSAMLTQLETAPALQRLVVDGMFGRAKASHLLRPRVMWEIARLLARRQRPA